MNRENKIILVLIAWIIVFSVAFFMIGQHMGKQSISCTLFLPHQNATPGQTLGYNLEIASEYHCENLRDDYYQEAYGIGIGTLAFTDWGAHTKYVYVGGFEK